MTLTAVLLIMAAIVLVSVLIGLVIGVDIDDKMHLLGGLAGLVIGSQIAFAVGFILVVVHFLGRVW